MRDNGEKKNPASEELGFGLLRSRLASKKRKLLDFDAADALRNAKPIQARLTKSQKTKS